MQNISHLLLSYLSSGDAWIGVTFAWVWEDGGILGTPGYQYTKWHSGEPNGDANGVCVNYHDSNFATLQEVLWNDVGCSHTKKYICEKGA